MSNLPELRSSTSLRHVFRKFAQTFALILAALSHKLQKDQPFVYTELCSMELYALCMIQETPILPPALVLPRTEGAYTVDNNTGDGLLGCAILKNQPDVHDKRTGCSSR